MNQPTILRYYKSSSTSDQIKQILVDIICRAVDSCISERETDSESCKPKRKRLHTGKKVQQDIEADWVKKYPWLEIQTIDGTKRLFCAYCKNTNKNNSFTQGSTNVQSNSIVRHEKIEDHKIAVSSSMRKRKADEAFHVGEDSNSESDSEVSDCESSEQDDPPSVTSSDKILFRTLYYCASEELPSSKVNSMLELQRLNGASCDFQNLSSDTRPKMLKAIADTLSKDLKSEIKKSEFYGILMDESEDLGNEKKLCVCIRYVVKGNPKTQFLSNIQLQDGKSHTIVSGLHSIMTKYDLSMRHAVGLGTDGAAAMTGRRMGAGVQIKSKYSPFITQAHCVAHRLALACSDSVKSIPCFETFKSRFNTLYFHFSSSATRAAKLQSVQEVLEDPVLKIKEPHHIRWLSMKNAVSAVYKTYPSVINTLAELGETNPVAHCLHGYFKAEKTAILCAFMYDVHEVLAVFSCVLQKSDIIFSELMPQLDMTIASLEELKTTDGKYLTKMKNDIGENKALKDQSLTSMNRKENEDLPKTMKKYLDTLIDNLKGRLASSDGDVITNFGCILEPALFNEDLADGAIEDLGNLYGQDRETQTIDEDGTVHDSVQAALLDKVALMSEWPRFKALLKGSYKKAYSSLIPKTYVPVSFYSMEHYYQL